MISSICIIGTIIHGGGAYNKAKVTATSKEEVAEEEEAARIS